jgi:hypothetical protein
MVVSRVVAIGAVLFVMLSLTGERVSGEQSQAASGAAPQPAAAKPLGGSAEHGRYLVEQVVMCGECHSTRGGDGSIAPGTRFKGGPMVVRPTWAAADWPNYFPRIAGLPGYTDEQALRLLTQGAIKRDGTQLRAPMPRFRMSQQDAADVIAFLRSL